MSKVLVIVGSTRPGRLADRVLPWLMSRITAHDAFDAELADLRDWPLPIFAEHMGTIGDLSDPTYSEPIVRAWNKKVKEADAYVVITPEYNHSVPAELKNAIDSVWLSYGFRNKPVAAVGYGDEYVGGGIRAIEHLAHVFLEAEAVPLATRWSRSRGWPSTTGASRSASRRTSACRSCSMTSPGGPRRSKARAGELTPGSFRARTALAAAQS